MWHLLVWAPLGLLITLWSLACWAALGLLRNLGPASQKLLLADWQIPGWLADWLPMDLVTEVKTGLTLLAEVLEALPQRWPDLLGWLEPLAWALWALGTGGLLLLGLIGSVAVAAVGRHRPVARTSADAGN